MDGLSEAQWQARTPLTGWCVHDVVAHLIGVESMLEGVATPEADIDVSTLKYVRNDIGVMNERWVRRLRGVSAADLLDRFRTVTAARRRALSDISDDDWNAVTRHRPGWIATGGSCACGSSTVGCTNTTSATPWAAPPPTWLGRRRGSHSRTDTIPAAVTGRICDDVI